MIEVFSNLNLDTVPEADGKVVVEPVVVGVKCHAAVGASIIAPKKPRRII